MPLADYAHWNEEAEQVWWQEEGRHAESDGEAWRSDRDDALEQDAADAFCEEMDEKTDDELVAMLADEDYLARWPQAARLLKVIAEDRGIEL